ncbi:MAG: hypothetical protein ND807_07885 [Vicinamibacterales bacterium]|nr:hypothetical protein [Vicinamibacterales bacterium]
MTARSAISNCCATVITNPRQVTTPYTADEALEEITNFLALPGMTLLPVPVDIVERWMALVKATPVTGPDVLIFRSLPRCSETASAVSTRTIAATSRRCPGSKS